jgi:MFS transporter, MHS family, proline/betaine transporter
MAGAIAAEFWACAALARLRPCTPGIVFGGALAVVLPEPVSSLQSMAAGLAATGSSVFKSAERFGAALIQLRPADSPMQRAQGAHWRALAAASIGNVFEWFDFIIYGFFAVTIARLFFPAGNETGSFLLIFASFGATFVMRPLGAVVLGDLADRHGRKAALTVSISMMMAGTAITGLAPTYASIGVFGPIVVVAARMIQGFSAGGEFGSAMVFLAEQNPQQRGLYASCQFASQGLSTVLATGFGAALNEMLTTEQMRMWGWRVPFLFGLLIGPIGYYIRCHVDETMEFRSAQTTSAPLRETFSCGKTRLLVAVGTTVLLTAAAYTAVYMPTYAIRELGLPPVGGFLATMVAGAIQIAITPLGGAFSDRLGRLPIAAAAVVALLVSVHPLFRWLTARPTIGWLLFVEATIGVLVAVYAGAIAALICELFPIRIRTTAVSTSYSLAVAIFGGFAPLIIASLIGVTGSSLAPSYYVIFAAAISLVALGAAYRLGFR